MLNEGNGYEKVMICFVSFLIGCESGGTQILITNQSVEKQNQSKQEIYVTFDIQLKSARAILTICHRKH